jgi:hypothetical protein
MGGPHRALVRLTAAAATGAAAALALTPAAEALAAKSSIRLRGPKVNTLGARFQYTVSGVAAARANHLYVWEAPATPACARTSGAQARRATLVLFASRAIARHRRFSLVLRFVARNTEKHRLCAYLANRRSGKTFARAEASWTNVAPPPPAVLQPAAVGRGLCPAKKFLDRSVYAQVAAVGVKCPDVESVAFGADGAHGAGYSRAGFTCAAAPQGAGSTWAPAWSGAYYAYSCASGARQIAFNWGTQYMYAPVESLQTVNPQP